MKISELYPLLYKQVINEVIKDEDSFSLVNNMVGRMLDEYARNDKKSEKFYPIAKQYVTEFHIKLTIIKTLEILHNNEMLQIDIDENLVENFIAECQSANFEMMF